MIDALLELGLPRRGASAVLVVHAGDGADRARGCTSCIASTAASTSPNASSRCRAIENSRPVRIGNGALEQTQLDIYGALLETAWLYSERHRRARSRHGRRLARIADYVCDIWREPDSGIWEVRERPVSLHAFEGDVLGGARSCDSPGGATESVPAATSPRWKREAAAIGRFVESECWSDAARQLHAIGRRAARRRQPADAAAHRLRRSGRRAHQRDDRRGDRANCATDDFVYRYQADDGRAGRRGVFPQLLVLAGRARWRASGGSTKPTALMERLVARANDVGLYCRGNRSARRGEFLGNFPQALVHLALIDAAIALDRAAQSARSARRPVGDERQSA